MYVLFVFIRSHIFKKDTNEIIALLVSLLLLGFSIYVWIKNGVLFDYGSEEEIKNAVAESRYIIALLGIICSAGYILITFFKILRWKVKNASR